jgi:hypothetical protein
VLTVQQPLWRSTQEQQRPRSRSVRSASRSGGSRRAQSSSPSTRIGPRQDVSEGPNRREISVRGCEGRWTTYAQEDWAMSNDDGFLRTRGQAQFWFILRRPFSSPSSGSHLDRVYGNGMPWDRKAIDSLSCTNLTTFMTLPKTRRSNFALVNLDQA